MAVVAVGLAVAVGITGSARTGILLTAAVRASLQRAGKSLIAARTPAQASCYGRGSASVAVAAFIPSSGTEGTAGGAAFVPGSGAEGIAKSASVSCLRGTAVVTPVSCLRGAGGTVLGNAAAAIAAAAGILFHRVHSPSFRFSPSRGRAQGQYMAGVPQGERLLFCTDEKEREAILFLLVSPPYFSLFFIKEKSA